MPTDQDFSLYGQSGLRHAALVNRGRILTLWQTLSVSSIHGPTPSHCVDCGRASARPLFNYAVDTDFPENLMGPLTVVFLTCFGGASPMYLT